MRTYYCLPLVAAALAMIGCEPDNTPPTTTGTSTTIVNPPAQQPVERVDVDVSPSGGVTVDTDANAVPGDKPVDVQVTPGGGVDVDVNPGEIREEIRERREERREAAETP